MQIASEQYQHIVVTHQRQRATGLAAQVDAALPEARRADPAARLAEVTRQVLQRQPPGALGAAIGVDVRQTSQWLALALAEGVRLDEPRAAALLHAAAALGALWFVDDRLLRPPEQLPVQPTLAATMVQLLGQAQGERFRVAGAAELQLRPGTQLWLRQVLAAPDDPDAARALATAAFRAWHDEAAPDDQELDPAQPGPAQQALQRFMQRERTLATQAGITDAALQRLCGAGDLALGQGRCVRLLAAHPEVAAADAAAWLKGLLHDLAGLQP